VKAFSEEPEQMSGHTSKVERLLKLLYVRRLYIWPRFKLEVARVFSDSTGKYQQPDVIEYSQPMSACMQNIQSAILVAMKGCMEEMKKQAPYLELDSRDSSAGSTSLTLENALFKNFDMAIRAKLEADWHHVNFKTRQLASDLTQLRKLLDYLLCYDAYSFYSFLLSVKSSSVSMQHVPSLW
jgi:DNA excision repair protein ERCC-4